MTPLNHASVIQDDEEVSALKERIIELEGAEARRQEEVYFLIESKDQQIGELERTIKEMQAQIGQ